MSEAWIKTTAAETIIGDAIRFSVKLKQRGRDGAKAWHGGTRRVDVDGRIVDAFEFDGERRFVLERTALRKGHREDTMLPDVIDGLDPSILDLPKAEAMRRVIMCSEIRTDEAGRQHLLALMHEAAGGDHRSRAAVYRVSQCCTAEEIDQAYLDDRLPMRLGPEMAARLLSGEERHSEAVLRQLFGRDVVKTSLPWQPAPRLKPRTTATPAPKPQPTVEAKPTPTPEPKVVAAAGDVDPEVAAIMKMFPGTKVRDVRMLEPSRRPRRKVRPSTKQGT